MARKRNVELVAIITMPELRIVRKALMDVFCSPQSVEINRAVGDALAILNTSTTVREQSERAKRLT